MSGYNNLKREGLRNRRDTLGSRAMVELKRSVRKGLFGRESQWPITRAQQRRQSCKSFADAPLTACMKEELSHGRHGKESHSVAQGGRQPSRDARRYPPGTFRSRSRSASSHG